MSCSFTCCIFMSCIFIPCDFDGPSFSCSATWFVIFTSFIFSLPLTCWEAAGDTDMVRLRDSYITVTPFHCTLCNAQNLATANSRWTSLKCGYRIENNPGFKGWGHSWSGVATCYPFPPLSSSSLPSFFPSFPSFSSLPPQSGSSNQLWGWIWGTYALFSL